MESEVQAEPTKGQVPAERSLVDIAEMESIIANDASEVAVEHIEEEPENQIEPEMQEDEEEEQEDSMCEAAEAQLLTEAGLEPIPADFAISPMKKQPVATAATAELQVDKATAEELNDSVMDDDVPAQEDAVRYPSLSESVASQTSAASEIAAEESSMPIAQQTPEKEYLTPATVAYPSIDIFGLDDEEVETPKQGTAQTEELAVEEVDDDDANSAETFAISLNDETVNLGALLAKNDSLAATITDDEIHLEVVDQDEKAENISPRAAQAVMELKDDDEDFPADSPDELSMDLDTTETVTTTGADAFTHLEDDKAKLSSFLRRMAERKEKKSANGQRRESLQDKQTSENRRDSDVVRKALASPRPVLEEKDKNVSPQRQTQDSTLNLDQVLTSAIVQSSAGHIATDAEELDELSSEYQTGSPRRRSFRTRSKLPQSLPQGIVPNKISVRTDGGEKVNLNRTEAQQLADLVRRNTKKNKGSSIPAPQRLAKLKLESLASIVDGESPVVEKLLKQGVKNVTWREQLADYATSTATADREAEAEAGVPSTEEGAIKAEPKKKAGSGTPRLRKLRALGGTNGTPAKKVIQSIQMPDEVEEEKPSKIASTTANAKKKRSVPALAVAPSPEEIPADSGVSMPLPAPSEEEKKISAVAMQKKSKLQPPKKLNLNPSLTSIGGISSGLPVLQGKENTFIAGLSSPAKKMSKIPAPNSIPAPSNLSFDLSSGLRPPVKRVRSGVGKKA